MLSLAKLGKELLYGFIGSLIGNPLDPFVNKTLDGLWEWVTSVVCTAGMAMGVIGAPFLHGTFDVNEEIVENIRSGVTLFAVDQQQALQGYYSIAALTLETRYGITVPPAAVTSNAPAFLTAYDLDRLTPLREPDVEQRFIAVQHAHCAWDSFWCAVEEGIAQAAEDTGVQVTFYRPDLSRDDPDDIEYLIDQAVAQKPHGILLSYTNLQLNAPVQRALDAGIPVVAYNAARMVLLMPGHGPQLDKLIYLSQGEYLGGYEGGRRMAAAAGSGSHVGVCINSAVGHIGLDARCQGFVKALSEAGISVAGNSGVLAVSDDPVSSQQTISDFYAANPAVEIFLTLGPNGATPFYGFLEQKGMNTADYVHGTFDLNQEIARNIRSGRTEFAIDQQPFLQGYGAITILYLNHSFGAVPPTPVTTGGPGFVTLANIDMRPIQYHAQRTQSVDLVAVQSGRCDDDTDSWWCTMDEAMNLAASNLGVNLQIRSPAGFDVNEAARLVDQARVSQPDGIAITISNADILRNSVKRVLADGIPAVGYNPRDYDSGYAGGKLLAKAAPRGSKAAPRGSKGVCVNHQVGRIGLDERCDGFAAAMEEEGLTMANSDGVLSISDDAAASTQEIIDYYRDNGKKTNLVFFTVGPSSATPFYDFVESGACRTPLTQ